MMLKCFLEYVNTTKNDKYVDFNKNEIKYLEDKADILQSETHSFTYYVNCREVKKTSNGEFLVVQPNIKCSTIQSLIKYTKNSIKEITNFLKQKFKDSEFTKDYHHNKWVYKGDIWAYQRNRPMIGNIVISNDYKDTICENYDLLPSELEIILSKLEKDPYVLKRFNEHSNDSSNTNAIKLNANEEKYLTANSDFIELDENEYYINFKYMKKLISGEFYVVDDNIKCSTIQSLLKYIKNISNRSSYKEATVWLQNLIKNSTKETIRDEIIWDVNGTTWAEQSAIDGYFSIRPVKQFTTANDYQVHDFFSKYSENELQVLFSYMITIMYDSKEYPKLLIDTSQE